jgi:hypothetical protein
MAFGSMPLFGPQMGLQLIRSHLCTLPSSLCLLIGLAALHTLLGRIVEMVREGSECLRVLCLGGIVRCLVNLGPIEFVDIDLKLFCSR